MSTPPQPFYGLFSGTTQVSRYQKRTSGLHGEGKINRGRHTDRLAGRHSIRSNQCPPPPSPYLLQVGCPSCRPTNSVKALKTSPCQQQQPQWMLSDGSLARTSDWFGVSLEVVIWRRNRFQGTASKVPEPVPKPGTRNRFLTLCR